jgi:D-alanine-D-alanine ligase
MARSVLLHRVEQIDPDQFESLGMPLFVKPNTHGSSFGVTKVKTQDALLPAIQEAFQFDQEVVVESYLPGREFSNGALRVNGQIIVLPVTEIIPEDEFFTYAAKYEGRSKEVTPAEISPELSAQCQSNTQFLYNALQCKGAVRFDYILVDETFHFLEANTIPGISPASIIPQQAAVQGIDKKSLITAVIQSCY